MEFSRVQPLSNLALEGNSDPRRVQMGGSPYVGFQPDSMNRKLESENYAFDRLVQVAHPSKNNRLHQTQDCQFRKQFRM